ncbi:E3 ubiquitin-protein ligase RGLG2-like isoform X2 [Castanea sativa]
MQQYYAPAQDYGSQNYGVGAEDFDHRRRLDRRYSRIADNFNSLEQVIEALTRAGLESSNLIVGIDFTIFALISQSGGQYHVLVIIADGQV